MGAVFLSALATPVVVLFVLIWRYSYWFRQGVPQGNPLKLFGDLNDVSITRMPYFKHYIALASKFSQKPFYGAYSASRPILIVQDAEMIKDIMVKKFSSFSSNGLEVPEEIDPIIGRDPFFQPNGQRWKELRASFSSLMTPGRLKAMFGDMTQVVNQTVKYLKEQNHESGKGDGANIKSIASKSMTSLLIRITLSLDAGSFKPGHNPFSEAEKKLFDHLINSHFSAVLLWVFPAIARLLRIRFVPEAVIDFYTNVVRGQQEYRKANGITRGDILDIAMKKAYDAKAQGSSARTNGVYVGQKDSADLDILSIIVMFITEGFETTSTNMSTTLSELARHPEIQNTIREKILSASPLGSNIQEGVLNDIPLLQNCILESIRLYPPLLFLQRIATENVTLEAKTGEKISLEEGAKINIPIYGNNRNPEYFPEPDKFDPHRFEDENQKRYLLSFGDGPRQCPGQRFAMQSNKLLLAAILREFKLELSPKTKMPLEPSNNPALFSVEEIFVRFVRL